MEVGEKIVIERLPSGLYMLTIGDIRLVGAAASTVVTLTRAVFIHEAEESPQTPIEE